jgi:DNA-binding response OmpR family regulator
MPNDLILLVDDEPNIIELARLYLAREGFAIEAAGSGPAGLEAAERLKPALIVLDVMLPGLDGFEVCKRLRASSDVPIVMLTARDDDLDKILGLELGADDYLTKPFNPRELAARVKAILRRSERTQTKPDSEVVTVGDVRVDPERREAWVAGKRIPLRVKEFDVLLVLARHEGRVLSRDQLLDLAWDIDFFAQTRTVDVHVAQVRKALAGSPSVKIETVTGVGYKLVVE